MWPWSPHKLVRTMDVNNENTPPGSSAGGHVWSKTSPPSLHFDRRSGGFRLSLKFTPREGERPERIKSPRFETKEAANAAAQQWRLNWEEGRRGRSIHGRLPGEITISAQEQSVAPLGKSFEAICYSCHHVRNHPHCCKILGRVMSYHLSWPSRRNVDRN